MEIVKRLYSLIGYTKLLLNQLDRDIRISPKRYHGNTIQASWRKRLFIPIWEDIAYVYTRDIVLLDNEFLGVFEDIVKLYEEYSGKKCRIILDKCKKPHWLEE